MNKFLFDIFFRATTIPSRLRSRDSTTFDGGSAHVDVSFSPVHACFFVFARFLSLSYVPVLCCSLQLKHAVLGDSPQFGEGACFLSLASPMREVACPTSLDEHLSLPPASLKGLQKLNLLRPVSYSTCSLDVSVQ